MSAEPLPPAEDLEISVSDARARLAELVDEAEAGKVIYLSRHGRRAAALVPADLPEQVASDQARAFARRFADRHGPLLDRLAE
ncbi:antitoxin Phd [Asanoa hainanensis]|uniref:Antitoxin n=1 Tax=Asanoa hainanensis TaxID=560556 RepID=A0A239P496_9ACTN|nr:type II toxin-antitoxin system prevent-host-death family antitoxin [Asanoa hainanensis]SNT61563.1 antitoxin Phd [Asanoa hainanensis]